MISVILTGDEKIANLFLQCISIGLRALFSVSLWTEVVEVVRNVNDREIKKKKKMKSEKEGRE